MSRALAWLCVVISLLCFAGCKADPNSPEYWDKALKSAKRTKERSRILENLRELQKLNASFLPMLHAHLQSEKQAEVKTSIARILGEMKDASSVQPLIDALDIGTSDLGGNLMNKEITAALGLISDPKATPTLLRLLKVRDAYTRIEAINALGVLRAKEAVAPLIEIATSDADEPFVSKKAIQALGEIGDSSATSALVKMMFRERRGVSFYVESSYALYQLGKPSADVLLPILRGEDKAMMSWAKENNIIEPALYAKAAQVLGDLHDNRAEKAMLQRLSYDNEFLDVKLFVRMRMADALGRLRTKDAAKPLAAMLDEEEATAREQYIRALTRIGGREAVPALVKAASKGSWDARASAMAGISMLGDEREIPGFDGFAKDEAGLTSTECKSNENIPGCNQPAELAKKRVAVIEGMKKRLEAARTCASKGTCWASKLDDADQGVRERAAYEVGRSGDPALVGELTRRLTEKNLDARLAIIQAVDWLVHDNKDAAQKAQAVIPALDRQISDEKGRTDYIRVNEDLRRLSVKLKRMGA